MSCNHVWRKLYEELVIGGTALIGYECKVCGEFVPLNKLTPAGLSGRFAEFEARLVPANGGVGKTSHGTFYKEQIVDEHGLHVITIDGKDISP